MYSDESNRNEQENTMVPSIGRIVVYRLGEADAATMNKRRSDAHNSGFAREETGAVVHTGNSLSAGQEFPMIITRVWDAEPTEASIVQGQVLLDGNDQLWVTSVKQGGDDYQWHEPVRS